MTTTTKVNRLLLAAFALSISILLWFCVQWSNLHEQVKTLKEQQETVQAKTVDDQRLATYVQDLMVITKAKLSDVQRNSIIGAIVRVSGKRFTKYEHRQAAATLVAIESKFDRNAKSPVGAAGLSQVMPRYISEFSDKCKLGTVSTTDLSDTETNLELGFCQFNELIQSFGSVHLALAAYNAGQSSQSVKELQSLSTVSNQETANYVLRYSYITAMVNSQGATK
jgi:hypothetical protein